MHIKFALKKKDFKFITIPAIKFKKLYFKNFNNFHKRKFFYVNIFFINNKKKENYLCRY